MYLSVILYSLLSRPTNAQYMQGVQKRMVRFQKFISHLTQAQHTPSTAATVQVSHALPAVRFSCLLRGRGVNFKDGVAAGKRLLCVLF